MPVNDEMDELRLSMVIYHWLRLYKMDKNKMDILILNVIIKYCQCNKSRRDYVRYEDGESMAYQLGASGYLECSALSQEGLQEVFEAACEWVMNREDAKRIFQKTYNKKYKNGKRDCVVL